MAQAGGSGQPTLRDIPCPDDVNADRCGYATVPLDHNHPAGQKIDVFFAVKAALSTLKESTPIFYMSGGPGTSSGEQLNALASRAFPEYDLVGVDYRGSALSRPALKCADPSAAGVALCAQSWKIPTADLPFFNSWQAAQDVESVRRALGFTAINIFGQSYGTYWAQVYAGLYPKKLRSMILSGVLPISVYGLRENIPALDNLMHQSLQACAQQSDCDAAHPDLLERYTKRWPTLTPTQRNELRTFVGLIGARGVYMAKLPNIIEAFLPSQRLNIPPPPGSGPQGIEWGLNSVVNCLEQLPLPPLTAEEASSRLLGGMSLSERTQLCQALGLKPTTRPTEIAKNVPTLLLNGKWDTRTPASSLEKFDPLPPHLAKSDSE